MKIIAIVFSTLALSITSAAFAASKGDDHAPKHGGIVVEVKDIDYELVAKPDRIQLYISNHGKRMDISKASAKVTLLVGTETQNIDLKVVGEKFEATGKFNVPAGAKVVANVNVGGKASSARFVLK